MACSEGDWAEDIVIRGEDGSPPWDLPLSYHSVLGDVGFRSFTHGSVQHRSIKPFLQETLVNHRRVEVRGAAVSHVLFYFLVIW